MKYELLHISSVRLKADKLMRSKLEGRAREGTKTSRRAKRGGVDEWFKSTVY